MLRFYSSGSDDLTDVRSRPPARHTKAFRKKKCVVVERSQQTVFFVQPHFLRGKTTEASFPNVSPVT